METSHDKTTNALVGLDIIKNRIMQNKPDVSETTLKRYSTNISQLLSEISPKQITDDPMSIEKTKICTKNVKSLRLYYQAILAYFGRDKFTQMQQNDIQDKISGFNKEEYKQVAEEDVSILVVDEKKLEQFLIQMFKEGIDRYKNPRSKNPTSGITKYLILDILYRFSQRVGVFENLKLLNGVDFKLTKTRQKYTISDKNDQLLSDDFNYFLIFNDSADLIINVFKTKDKYKQLLISIKGDSNLNKILIECLNILLKEGHIYLSQSVDKKTKQTVSTKSNCLSTKIPKWSEQLGKLTASTINKIGINSQVRADVQNLKQIAKNRGTNAQVLLEWYQKLDKKE